MTANKLQLLLVTLNVKSCLTLGTLVSPFPRSHHCCKQQCFPHIYRNIITTSTGVGLSEEKCSRIDCNQRLSPQISLMIFKLLTRVTWWKHNAELCFTSFPGYIFASANSETLRNHFTWYCNLEYGEATLTETLCQYTVSRLQVRSEKKKNTTDKPVPSTS